MKFKKTTYSLILIGLIALSVTVLSGCADDILPAPEISSPGADGPKVDAYLSLNVADFTVSGSVSRAEPEVATEEENRISDIWVFQYDTDGNQLINPAYYVISDPEELNNLHVLLRDGVVSTICVVANTANPTWAVGKDNFKTYSGLKSAALSFPRFNITKEELTRANNPRSIPMEGEVSGVTIISNPVPTSIARVTLTKMYAKLRITFGTLINGMSPQSMEIVNIPNYCRVTSLGKDLTTGDEVDYENPVSYPQNAEWLQRSFNTSSHKDGDEYIIYIPENLQGKTEDTGEEIETEVIPEKALGINLTMNYKADETAATTTLDYSMYPGETFSSTSTVNEHFYNFNLKRNQVYRVKINILSASQDKHTPSSNCLVVIPGETLSFEPYFRTEKGGGYKFTDYLDPKDESGDKVIDHVGIIWQTKAAIGNNNGVTSETQTQMRSTRADEDIPEGKLVWFEPADVPLHSKIYVKTHKEGNALIGAYNSKGEIIWSWHIWITRKDPGNVGKAVVYTTYRWEGSANGKGSIKYDEERVSGYAIMPCNLGALANEPEFVDPTEYGPNDDTPDSEYCRILRTYGLLYQWGRKDPFPCMKTGTASNNYKNGGFYYYSKAVSRIEVYDNSHSEIRLTTDGSPSDTGELFESILSTGIGSNKEEGLKYSINNPTMFIAGAVKFNSTADYNNTSKYLNRGDWLPERDECLWGGITRDNTTEHYKSPYGDYRAIWRNYGPEKTIFDPCPNGWRVAPGDLWLGFTNTGLNANFTTDDNMLTQVNRLTYRTRAEVQKNNGYWLCMDGWQTDTQYTFFPTQGSRLASGQPLLGGVCGNYHNATTDAVQPWNVEIDRVNILHLHCDVSTKINTFEDQLLYYNKSVAGPIRCVRDKK